jgi:hypothetical protein
MLGRAETILQRRLKRDVTLTEMYHHIPDSGTNSNIRGWASAHEVGVSLGSCAPSSPGGQIIDDVSVTMIRVKGYCGTVALWTAVLTVTSALCWS